MRNYTEAPVLKNTPRECRVCACTRVRDVAYALCDTRGNSLHTRTYGSFIVTSIQLTTIFPVTKGRRGEYEVSHCQKADCEDTTAPCVCAFRTQAERTRQSRIPIAPSRYRASCGAATIKAPVTHCSCPGQ